MNLNVLNLIFKDLTNEIIEERTFNNIKEFNYSVIKEDLSKEDVNNFISNRFERFFYYFLTLNKKDEQIQYDLFDNFYFLIINVKDKSLKDYLIRSEYFNKIIKFNFNFNEDFICVYVNFMKSISLFINNYPLGYFYNYDLIDFPLVTSLIKLIDNQENLIKTSIFNIYGQVWKHKDINNFPSILMFPLNIFIPYLCFDIYNNIHLLIKTSLNKMKLINILNECEFNLQFLNEIYNFEFDPIKKIITNCLILYFVKNLIIEINNKYYEIGIFGSLIGVLIFDYFFKSIDIYNYFIYDNSFLYDSTKENLFFLRIDNSINNNYFHESYFENIYNYENFYNLNIMDEDVNDFHNKIGLFYNEIDKNFYTDYLYDFNKNNYNPILLYKIIELLETKDCQLLLILLTIIENILKKFSDVLKQKEIDIIMKKLFNILFNKINFNFHLLYKINFLLKYNKNNYIPFLKNNFSNLIMELFKFNDYKNFEFNFINLIFENNKLYELNKDNFIYMIFRNNDDINIDVLNEVDIIQKKIIFIYKVFLEKSLLKLEESNYYKFLNTISLKNYKIDFKKYIIGTYDKINVIIGFDDYYFTIYNKKTEKNIFCEKYTKIKLKYTSKNNIIINDNFKIFLEDKDDFNYFKTKVIKKYNKMLEKENKEILEFLKDVNKKIN